MNTGRQLGSLCAWPCWRRDTENSLEGSTCDAVDDDLSIGTGSALRGVAVEAIAGVHGDAAVAWNAVGVALTAVGVARGKLCDGRSTASDS